MTLVKIKDHKVVIGEPKIPNLEQQTARSEEAGNIQRFLEWLFEEWVPAKEAEQGKVAWELRVGDIPRTTIVNEYFGLSEKDLENERRLILMLARISNANINLRKDKKIAAMKPTARELHIYSQLLVVEKEQRKELGVA